MLENRTEIMKYETKGGLFAKPFQAVLYDDSIAVNHKGKEMDISFESLAVISPDADSPWFSYYNENEKWKSITIPESPLSGDAAQLLNLIATTHAKWLLKDVTPENIYQTKISFGEFLELDNGEFFNKNRKKSAELVHVNEIATMQDGYGNVEEILLEGVNHKGKDGKTLLKVPQVSNIHALIEVINMK